jgi:N-methylhydantoinase A
LLLGRLSEDRALGGSVVLDMAAAAAAVEKIRPSFSNLTSQALAEGIVRLAVAKMTAAIREVSVARGLDPREFVLFAYGGAGPMHATEVAAELDIPKVVIPPAPGNFSALGLIMSDVRHDYVVSRYAPVKSLTPGEYEALFVDMEEAASGQLQREGFTTDEISFSRSADIRYRGQWFELNVPVPDRPGSLNEIDALFRRTHLERFQVDMDRPTEFVNLRVAAQGLVAKPSISVRSGLARPNSHTRQVVFDGRITDTRVLDRFELPSGFEFVGPAIVDEPGATTVVSPGFRVVVHESGALFLEAS